MPATHTPLRYPGGKTKLYSYLLQLLQQNSLTDCSYVEPFAGGAGLALALLLKGNVKEIILNDYDYSIYSFWYCILNQTGQFIDAIEKIPVTIEEWYRQREVQKEPNKHDMFTLAISTFFLNRVNRSGIIKGGVIGGMDQTGVFKLDCRFNKKGLINKVQKIAVYKEQIRLYNLDAKAFISDVVMGLPVNNTFIYFDPPYIIQGSNLYCNFFVEEDHRELCTYIKQVPHHWILTYDNEPIVYEMYSDYKKSEFNLKYSAGPKKDGKEIIVYNKNVTSLSFESTSLSK
jgi:DNA adenine methylase